MNCQKCDSDRILCMSLKIGREWYADYKGGHQKGYVEDIINVKDSCGYVVPQICLECGQVQGKWPQPDPKTITEEEEQEEEEEFLVDTIGELHSEIMNHACKDFPDIHASDFPSRWQMGWVCFRCERIWTLQMKKIKDLILEEGIPEMYPKLMMDAKGRQEIARLMNEEIRQEREE